MGFKKGRESVRVRSLPHSLGELLEIALVGIVVVGLQVAKHRRHRVMEALASAPRQKSAGGLEQVAVATDHSFSDRRIELQSIVIKWLETLKK
jgi:hypothetical protein